MPLTHIINQSMTTGVVPEDMKIARVIPIFKSGNQNMFNNYRPISILPAFSKILEKTIATKLMKFLESQNLIYEHQCGFRPKHSTIHPIIHLLNQIVTENDKTTKNLTLSVFIDLSKAFDTISHEILLKKMENLGIRGISNLWFRSYLSNRKQFMEIYNIKSSLETLKCGVPQGSILGPILFLIYVNDISNCSNVNLLSFADDTTVSISSENIPVLYQSMNSELEKLNTWFRANRLCLNVNKTKYILFSPNYNRIIPNNVSISLNGQKVNQIGNMEQEKSFKFLGILLDENLSWKFHIQKVCKKVASANYIINKTKHFLPESTLRNLYSSLVHSHINYGLLLWGYSKSIGQLTKMQKKSIRIIHGKPYNYHTEPLFKSSNILKIEDQYTYNVLIFMHQLKAQKLPNAFSYLDYFLNRPNQPHTRQINLANCKTPRTTFTSLLPFHRFPIIWNDLDASNHDINSVGVFKRKIKASMIDNYANIINCSNNNCRQCHP